MRYRRGWMIGRTPEYIGKKTNHSKMKMTSIVILCDASWCWPRRDRGDDGGGKAVYSTRGAWLLGILYALSSGRQQRQRLRRPLGQHAFHNTLLAVAMWSGGSRSSYRCLAIAGSCQKEAHEPPPASADSGPLFVAMPRHGVAGGRVDLCAALAWAVVEHLQAVRDH